MQWYNIVEEIQILRIYDVIFPKLNTIITCSNKQRLTRGWYLWTLIQYKFVFSSNSLNWGLCFAVLVTLKKDRNQTNGHQMEEKTEDEKQF